MKKNWLLLLLFWLQPALAMHPNQQDIDSFLRKHQLPASALTLVALPLDGNPNSGFSFNDDSAINPASVIKLVTTYAALELLGPDYSWQTELLTDGKKHGNTLEGNLYFRSGGDPKLGIEQLWLLLRELKLLGIERITGDLILDDSYYWTSAPLGYQGQKHDKHRAFMVEANSLLINFNAQQFRVIASDDEVMIISDPPIPSVQIENKTKLLPAGRCNKNTLVFHPQYTAGRASLRVSGGIAPGCSVSKYYSILPHDTYAADTIVSTWQDLGGRLEGSSRLGQAPEDAVSLAKIPSINVAQVISYINKYSNNPMAKQLFLTIGLEHRQQDQQLQDDQLQARQVIKKWWQDKGLEVNQLNIENGSGLSQSVSLNARQLASMLEMASKSPFYPEFAASLPIVAVDGTMRKRLTGSKIQNKARIKTGTLRNVRAIAGYVSDVAGHNWVIVAIINHEKAQLRMDILDSLLESLYLQQPLNN